MNQPLDDSYLEWLYCQVGNGKLKNPRRTHWTLLRQLYGTEFVWLIPNDDNRVADGIELRYEFVHDYEIVDPPEHWMVLGCSFLEMLVALSRRFAFEADGEPADWFWHMMDNLGLRQFNDSTKFNPAQVDAILKRVIWRQYDEDGRGGLFPLRDPKRNQRDVEIWYQLGEYILELGIFS